MDWDGEERGGKRDRLARLARVVTLLSAHPEGMRPREIAERVRMSVRSVYRDLRALEGELAIPVWSEGGRWGVAGEAFLPTFRLTGDEAMAVFLAARLAVRYADHYDPSLASAFEKLAGGLPAPLAEHVNRTLDLLQSARFDGTWMRNVRELTRAWAERRVVEFEYAPATYEGRQSKVRRAVVRPYLLEPSLETHALYLIGWDEARDALRTFKVDRIREVVRTPRIFEPPEPGTVERSLRRAWDIIADQPTTEVTLRFAAAVADRVAETTWHPTQRLEPQPDGSLDWRGTVAGTTEIRLWILSWGVDVEVIGPPALRTEVAAALRDAAARYG